MLKEILANVRFHPDAKGVAPIGDDEVQERANYIGDHHDSHYQEKSLIGMVGQEFLHGCARHQRVDEVYQRHIDGEPQPEYYVCYVPDCILQLDLSWEPTAQEIAVIREKLGI